MFLSDKNVSHWGYATSLATDKLLFFNKLKNKKMTQLFITKRSFHFDSVLTTFSGRVSHSPES